MRLTTVSLSLAFGLLASTSAFALDTTRLPVKNEAFIQIMNGSCALREVVFLRTSSRMECH